MKLLIAAGGTGGHIYPALALAKALKSRNPNMDIHFVGTRSGLETQLVPREGFDLQFLSIGRLNSNVSKAERLTTLLRLPLSFVQSLWLLWTFRPHLVVGVGGHASGPLLLMASLCGFSTAIWEPNAMPGMANRILARFVSRCFVVFEGARKYFAAAKCHVVGLPVRQEIEQLHSRAFSVHRPLQILIFGGSQGARSLNTVVMETFRRPLWQGRVRVVHQTGAADFDRIQREYGDQCPWVEALPYLYDMDQRYMACDLVIARSGTGTLSELAASQRPSLLVPLATAADNHQQKNAEAFVAKGAARMILQKDFSADSLTGFVEEMLAQPSQLERMAQSAGRFFTPRAAENLAEELVKMISSD